jgi:hypothetical protein
VNSTDAHVRAARLRVLSEAVTKLLVAVALAAVTIALAIVLVRQNHVVSSTEEQKRTLQILVDCTTIGHPCYEHGVARTNAIRRQLQSDYEDISIGANYCTTRHPHITMPDLIDCVLTVVKQLEKIRLPVPMDTQATPTRVPVSPHPSRSP